MGIYLIIQYKRRIRQLIMRVKQLIGWVVVSCSLTHMLCYNPILNQTQFLLKIPLSQLYQIPITFNLCYLIMSPLLSLFLHIFNCNSSISININGNRILFIGSIVNAVGFACRYWATQPGAIMWATWIGAFAFGMIMHGVIMLQKCHEYGHDYNMAILLPTFIINLFAVYSYVKINNNIILSHQVPEMDSNMSMFHLLLLIFSIGCCVMMKISLNSSWQIVQQWDHVSDKQKIQLPQIPQVAESGSNIFPTNQQYCQKQKNAHCSKMGIIQKIVLTGLGAIFLGLSWAFGSAYTLAFSVFQFSNQQIGLTGIIINYGTAVIGIAFRKCTNMQSMFNILVISFMMSMLLLYSIHYKHPMLSIPLYSTLILIVLRSSLYLVGNGLLSRVLQQKRQLHLQYWLSALVTAVALHMSINQNFKQFTIKVNIVIAVCLLVTHLLFAIKTRKQATTIQNNRPQQL